MDGVADDADAVAEVVIQTSGTVLVKLVGELDLGNVDAVDAQVAPVLAEKPPRLIIDVTELEFADSSAIALWVRWAGSVRQLELRNVSPLLRRVVTTMGLGEKLGVTP